MSPADDDDEKTITGPLTPGRRRMGAQASHVLPSGTRLRDYEITGLIGEGGFGIVYLAWDHSLQRQVAIKEYMPASMAARVAGSSAIVVKSERHLDTFRAGLKSFVNEARLLARFDHPALVKVYRFWEENGTAYMVMPYYEGPTLKAALAALGRPPGEAELRAWLGPLLDALDVMHAAHCYHRDIAPDNILLTRARPAAARLRRRAPRDRRHDARDHRRPEAGLRTDRAVRRRRLDGARARGPTCTRSPRSSTTRSKAARRSRRSSG